MTLVGRILAGQPLGKQMWVGLQGRSLWPLLRGGESLRVERCEEASIARGQLAVLLRDDGALICHLVQSVSPLRTVSITGALDSSLRLLAKVVAVRSGERVVPLPTWSRWPLAGFQSVWSTLARNPFAQRAWSRGWHALVSPATSGLRARWSQPLIRRVSSTQLAEATVVLARFSPAEVTRLPQHLETGTVVLAGDLGILVLDAERRIVHASLARRAWNLGIEARMLASVDYLAVASGDLQPGFRALIDARGG